MSEYSFMKRNSGWAFLAGVVAAAIATTIYYFLF